MGRIPRRRRLWHPRTRMARQAAPLVSPAAQIAQGPAFGGSMIPREPVEPPIAPCTLVTPRLRLRSPADDDLLFIHRALADPRVGRGVGVRNPYNPTKSNNFFRKIPDELKHGTGVVFTIPLPTAEPIGIIGASLHLDSARATIWYWLDVPSWK